MAAGWRSRNGAAQSVKAPPPWLALITMNIEKSSSHELSAERKDSNSAANSGSGLLTNVLKALANRSVFQAMVGP